MTFSRPGWGPLLETAAEVHGEDWAARLRQAIAACDSAGWPWWDTWDAAAALVGKRHGDPETLRRRAHRKRGTTGLPVEIAELPGPQPPEVAAAGAGAAREWMRDRVADLGQVPSADGHGGAA